MVRSNAAIVLILVLISPTLSGCLGPVSENGDVEQYEHWLPPVEERSGKEYRNDDVFSRVSINGTYDTGDVQSIFVPVPSISVSDGEQDSREGPKFTSDCGFQKKKGAI